MIWAEQPTLVATSEVYVQLVHCELRPCELRPYMEDLNWRLSKMFEHIQQFLSFHLKPQDGNHEEDAAK